MKNFLATILAIFMASGWAFAQETESKSIVKTKEFSMLGMEWTMNKFEDGTKEWNFENDQETKTYVKPKPSKFDSDLNIDLGINVWTPSDDLPATKAWGSWNVGLNWVGDWKAAKNFHLKTGIGVSWYNYKLENRNLIIEKSPNGIEFNEFTNGVGTKSKLSASYANLSLVPTLMTSNQKVRIGLGGYAGLRIGGRGKFVYEDNDGDKNKIFEKSNLYANNLRYGARAEIGIGDFDLYFNYDLNSFFEEGRGPETNAISFGIIIN
ncbi:MULTISPECIES: hypothetical protein [unclassified Algoriphagus]|jgi:hypothetical protein|uniref:hypothetical protein n=1 Tax=unclassified Algoriphagus TaxID=2641541 RepID=UPI001C62F2B1|nr:MULTISPECIES: hypothetical protein [unclassified Algoriphagus]QYH39430.1 hypothetical protein GYM62_11785 [Algoriphagus sp. NBT04N3]|tara:strand:- start:1012 stop:1806 length:795 start_codon:yes stop_codon:yes gene_type:complete